MPFIQAKFSELRTEINNEIAIVKQWITYCSNKKLTSEEDEKAVKVFHKSARHFQSFLDNYINLFLEKLHDDGLSKVEENAELLSALGIGITSIETLANTLGLRFKGDEDRIKNCFFAIANIKRLQDLLLENKTATTSSELSVLFIKINQILPHVMDEDHGRYAHFIFAQRISDYLKLCIERPANFEKINSLLGSKGRFFFQRKNNSTQEQAEKNVEKQEEKSNVERIESQLTPQMLKQYIETIESAKNEFPGNYKEVLNLLKVLEESFQYVLSMIETVLSDETHSSQKKIAAIQPIMQEYDFSKLIATLKIFETELIKISTKASVGEFLKNIAGLHEDLCVLDEAKHLVQELKQKNVQAAEKIVEKLSGEAVDALGKVVDVCAEVLSDLISVPVPPPGP